MSFHFLLIIAWRGGDVDEIVSYNFYDEYPKCKLKAKDQKKSNTCFAHSVATAFSLRLCKKKDMLFDLDLREIISCDPFSGYGLNGGSEIVSWKYIYYNGLPNISCSSQLKDIECEVSKCEKYKVRYDIGSISGEANIKKEILENGPVTVSINVKYDFFNDYKGIYDNSKSDDDNILHKHSVVIIGWGSYEGIPYWIVLNSYGSNWGIDGLGKILRGNNTCDIEDYVTFGNVD